MNTWIISDQHYFHRNIISFCQRPFKDVNEMNEQMVVRHNKVVGSDDIVIHCGDFGFGNIEQLSAIFKQLNGKKHLLAIGNHDASYKAMYSIGFDSVVKSMSLSIDGIPLFFTHKPQDVPQWAVDNHFLCVTGHTHVARYSDLVRACEPTQYNSKIMNVCVEYTAYQPVSLNWILKNREKLCLKNQLEKSRKESLDFESNYGIA